MCTDPGETGSPCRSAPGVLGTGVCKTVSSDQGWLILTQEVWEIYGPCFWEELQGGGRGSEDSAGFSNMPTVLPQWLLIIGNLAVRYSARDANLLCSSVGGGLGPPCPSTF